MKLDHIQKAEVAAWGERFKFTERDPRCYISEFKNHDLAPWMLEVPKHPLINIWWRKQQLDTLFKGKPRDREEVLLKCKEDVLWWINTFCSIHEPRNPAGRRTFPCLTFPYQDDAILRSLESIGVRDIVWLKSRDVGASWMSLFVACHKYIFEDEFSCGVVTKDEKTCYDRGNMSTLFSKIDMILKKQPAPIHNWRKDTECIKLRTLNLRNSSGFFGYSCNGDVARGGRMGCFIVDEFDAWMIPDQYSTWASLDYVTNSRFIIATPRSREGLYYKLVSEAAKREITLVDVGWESDPRRNRGLYRAVKGKLELLDVEYWNHFGEGSYVDEETGASKFILDGKIRSPWYDKACENAGTPQQIARELDRDFSEAQSNFFPTSVVEKIEKDCRQPNHTGHVMIEGDEAPGTFVSTKNGPFKIWTPLSSLDWTPVEWSRYVIGVDLCQGLNGDQTSNSVIEILDRRTEEQIGEFTARDIMPADMADLTVAVARWLNDAHLIWDADGPGRAFTKRVEELGYPHVYWHRSLDANYGAKPSNKMGFYIKDSTKDQLLGRLRQGLMRKQLKVNSQQAADEMPQFIFKDGKIAHSKALVTSDDGSKGVSHGDCVIALALAWWYHVDLPPIDPAEPPAKKVHRHTMQWREEQHRKERSKEDAWI